MLTIFYSIVLMLTIILSVLEIRRVLMMLQQNSYRAERYMRWLRSSGDSTSTSRLFAFAVLFFGLARIGGGIPAAAFAGVLALAVDISLGRAHYKKPLVMTRRAQRIALVAAVLMGAVMVVGALTGSDTAGILYGLIMACTACYAASHVIILVANWLLKPVEKAINRRYYRDAERILQSMPDLKIIGITGSYGKTSTKHYLHRILSEQFDTLMTPGSFNTTLGVIRTVREYLKPYNEVFIVEMGAKQPGDIREICDLVHPSVGIVTAVGEQHLESFKSIENVQRTKFELIDALPADGLAVVNDDFPFVANREVDNVECRRYAVSNTGAAAYTATDIRYSASGTEFTVCGPDGLQLQLHTHLVGECNISNLLGAVIVALHLGVPHDKIRYAVEKIEQVEHRLNVKRTPGGLTIIDDAFNSNPDGSRMALEVLGGFNTGKRIVITPGMIELGERQYELNRVLGNHIADNADVAIVVGQYNRDALLEGINSKAETNSNKPAVHAVDSFAEAQRLLASFAQSGDTVLYENDLPDTFK